jgi:putative selenium metabolism hydrolase
MDKTKQLFEHYEDDLIAFTQKAVQTQSYSDEEGPLARLVEEKMRALGYDQVLIDSTGNVVGRIGCGSGAAILFDSHLATVEVHDAQDWEAPPFSGRIVDGKLYGRGSVDMKSGLTASVFAAAMAKRLGLLEDKTVYVTGSVCEEYCDGVNLKLLFAESGIRPDYAVICEPSDNLITLGHKGKAQTRILTRGVSAHGSAPEKGVNAVYEMAEIITRVDRRNRELAASGNPHGTMVLSDIRCVSASLNAVPSECGIYIDRRLVMGETEETVRREMDTLIAGKDAFWELGTLRHTSWTGKELVYEPLHEPWAIGRDHPLTLACNRAYEALYRAKPSRYDFWDFGTNAVTPVSMSIPTIGFGPGDYKLAHMRNEHCAVDKIKEACLFYTLLIQNL